MSGQRSRTVAIRVDASPGIGLGHVMRCLTLANALTEQGFESVFFARVMIEDMKRKLGEAGHRLVMLPEGGPQPGPTPYGSWLGTTEEHDAEVLGGHMKALQPQIIVVDHYALGIAWERAMRSSTDQSPLILAFDDLSRPHDCDIALDATLGRSPDDYADLVPDHCRVLTGPRHALLRPDFAAERPASLRRRDEAFAAGTSVQALLIFMGGADSEDCTGWTLRGLCELPLSPDVELHVVTGPAYPHQDSLMRYAEQSGRSITLHRNVSEMAALMSGMDLVLGAAGSSSWERCCLGVPAINLVLADNQKEAAQALSRTGACVDGGVYEPRNDPRGWAEAKVAPLLKPAATHPVSLAAREVTDGNGAARVVTTIKTEWSNGASLHLRSTRLDDAELLFKWQQDPRTRRFSPVRQAPTWEEHQLWIRQKLEDPDSSFYIAFKGDRDCGAVRLDRTEAPSPPLGQQRSWREVSISIAPELHGQGLATSTLKRLQEIHNDEVLVARIFEDNTASIRLFSSAGFRPYAPQYFVWDPSLHKNGEQMNDR